MLNKRLNYSVLLLLLNFSYMNLLIFIFLQLKAIFLKKLFSFFFNFKSLLQFSTLTKKLAYNYLIKLKTKSKFLKKKLVSYKKSMINNKYIKFSKTPQINFSLLYKNLSNLLLNVGFCSSSLMFIGSKSIEYEIFLFNLYSQNLFSAVQNSAPLKYLMATRKYSSFMVQPSYCFLLEPKIINLRNILLFRNRAIPILGIGTVHNSSFIYDKIFYVSKINKSTVYSFFILASNYYFLGIKLSKQYHFENFSKQCFYLYFKYLLLLETSNNVS